jgi:hypothetical protein
MSEAVPLRTALGVHVVNIIVGEVLGQCLDLLFEHFAAEGRLGGYIEWKTVSVNDQKSSHSQILLDWYDLARLDLLRSSCNARGREQVQPPNLWITLDDFVPAQFYTHIVIFALDPRSFRRCTRYLRQFLP